jgi:hypothetical protein
VARKTRVERRLVAYLKEQFGEHLGVFLLSGYETTRWSQRRELIISTTDRVGNREEHSVILLAVGAHSIPFGQDPVVLAAHLQMLSERGAYGRLSYDLFEMMGVLGQVDPLQGLKAIEGALHRYYRLSYAAEGKRRHPLAPLGEGVTAARRILTAYDFEHEPVRTQDPYPTMHTVVEFSQRFLEQLRLRSLFGIDWNLVTSVVDKRPAS